MVLAISTLYLEGEWRDHTCAVSDVPSRVEFSSFIDSSPGRRIRNTMIDRSEAALQSYSGSGGGAIPQPLPTQVVDHQ